MNPDEKMTTIIGGKRYSIKTAEWVADNCWWDGHNFERSGRNTYLYRTPKGAFFFAHLTQWQGERNRIEPCSMDEALAFWESARDENRDDFEDAFPGAQVENA